MTHLLSNNLNLVIDTSSRICQVAITQHDQVLAHVVDERSHGYGEIIFGLLGRALKESGIEKKELSAIYAITGPGSFTGVRVGVSAALGVHMGLEIPLFGISAFKAHKTQNMPFGQDMLVILDARRVDVYVQAFSQDGVELTSEMNISLVTLEEMFSNRMYRICGDYAESISHVVCKNWHKNSNSFLKPLSIVQTEPEQSYAPLYVRPPDVGFKKKD